jgi:dTDP-4-amino-4,6-dideoxygalactose transaminase
VGTDSGLSALELILRSYGIGAGDEVITAANTFIATALAISHAGATPVLVDIDPETSNLDPRELAGAITSRTKAIMPVHLYGQPANMDAIQDVAGRRGLRIIEDACQAHGARYRGRRVGALADAGAFSFYPAKNLGAFGDGGAVVTNDPELNQSVRMLRDYGQREKHNHVVKGFNRRLDTFQAGVLRLKLRRLDRWNDQRRTHAALYQELLDPNGSVRPTAPDHVQPVWHLYVIRVPDRDGLRARLHDQGIGTGIHYPVPLHLQPAYADLGAAVGSFPVTERHAAEVISLPMYPELEANQIRQVAKVVCAHVRRTNPVS